MVLGRRVGVVSLFLLFYSGMRDVSCTLRSYIAQATQIIGLPGAT